MKKWGVIIALAMGTFIMVLDTTVMNVSITTVVSDLDTTIAMVQLAITLYTLVMAAFMMTGGKCGDIWGRKRAFMIGLVIYGIGSLTTALSPNIEVLLVGWSIVEGLGAALVVPAIASLAAANYTGRDRAIAFSILGAAAGVGAAAGPLIGGLATTYLSWRVVFAAETVVVLALLPALKIIKEEVRIGPKPKLDLNGSILSVIGMSLVVLGILKSSEWGFLTPKGVPEIAGVAITPFGLSVVPFLILGGGMILYFFFTHERRMEKNRKNPLLHPELLKNTQLNAGLSMYVAQYLVLAGVFFVIPVYLQVVIGKNAIQTGLQILPMSIAMVLTAMLGPRLATAWSPKRVVQIGLGLVLIGVIVLMWTLGPELAAGGFTVGLILFGAGMGFTVSQLGNVVMSSVGDASRSEAGGLQGTSQNLGSALGTAFIGAVLIANLTSGFQDRIRADTSIPASVSQQIVSQTKAGVDIVSQKQAEQIVAEAGLPPDQAAAVAVAYSEAQISALKKSFFWAGVLVIIGFVFARRLPGEKLGTEPVLEDAPAQA